MKKMLKSLAGIAIMLVLVIGVVGTVFAATSKQDGVEVTSDTDFTIGPAKGSWTPLDKKTAADLINAAGGNVKESELTILWEHEIIVKVTGSVTMTFTADGVSSPQKLYAFHNNWDAEDVWSLVDPTAGAEGNKITATFPHLSPVALVVYTPSGTSGGETSPKTGETNALLFIALAAIALGGVTAFVVAKKKA